MNRIGSSKLFRRYFLSYLIILMIPLLAGFITYHVSIKTAEKYSIINSTQILQQGKTILEQRMDELDRFVRQIASNNDLNTLLNKNVTEKTRIVSSVKQLSEEISPISVTNEFLEGFYIYFRRMDLVMVPGSVYFRPDHFYQQYHYTNLTVTEWKQTVLEGPRQILPSKEFVNGEEVKDVITYMQPLPMNSFSNYNGSLVIPIDTDKINKLLNGISMQFGGWVFVMDNDRNIITSNGIEEADIQKLPPLSTDNNQTYLDDGTLLISIESERNNWTYVAGIPSSALTRQAAPIKYITWFVTIGTLILGFVICLFFAYRNSRPITKLVKTLKEYTGTESNNEYDFLHGNISKLIAAKTDLQLQIAEQVPLIKDAFLKQLLSGEMTEKDENLFEFARLANIELSTNKGNVIVLKIEGYEELMSKDIYEELQAIRLVIHEESKKHDNNFYLTNVNSDKLVYIFIDEQGQEKFTDNIEKMFQSLQAYLYKEYRIMLKVGAGHRFETFSEISRSYHEAKQAIEYAVLHTETCKVHWYDDVMKETAVLYYPLEYEFRLLKNLKDGEADEAKKIISELFSENIDKRCLPADMLEQFLYEVKGTFLKSLDQYIFPDKAEYALKKLASIQVSEDLLKTKSLMMDFIDYYCQKVNKERQKSNDSLVNDIREFLENTYPNADLTIYSIAEQFGRPEKYMTQLFKEETGEYIYEYLEKIRIDESLNLLENTNYTVNEISEKVGYNSAHSFRRAFKRMNNVTPTQFRNSLDK
ncbi:helix-turn-helix domain-containing protein [Gracilibacillus oryzae]|uniref:Helix-turn-helix domain-containing protein n=1 Tax=Gracilibacillus oryzae TaxID=1672701 RepID=A0A7C8GS86_9BACI|nr:helix-turn-helix domain-containing protein [Gracilibacillus oryzae]KAB8130771.1 helix-turn-helix domain-containing protein [Gracilibacillus oryzae]